MSVFFTQNRDGSTWVKETARVERMGRGVKREKEKGDKRLEWAFK